MSRAAFALLATVALIGCAHRPRPVVTVSSIAPTPKPTGWRAIASPADQLRLDGMTQRWATAHGAVGKRFATRLAAEGPLVQPTAAQELPMLPPGPYHCRLLRFGGSAGFASYKPDFCYVLGDDKSLTFTKMTGSTLPGGWIYPDTPTRQIFLGSMRSRPQDAAAAYGSNPARNVAGVIERVAPMRWRLTLAQAGRGALLDVYELVPVTPEVPGAAAAVPGPA